jgi:hypothetical protein
MRPVSSTASNHQSKSSRPSLKKRLADKKWLAAAAAFLLLVAGVFARNILNPWEWYRQFRASPSTSQTRSGNQGDRLDCSYFLNSEAGTTRDNILQDKDRYKISTVKITLANASATPAVRAYMTVNLGPETRDAYLTGPPDAEYRREDGSYRRIGSDPVKVTHAISIRYDRVPPGASHDIEITFSRLREDPLGEITIAAGDDLGLANVTKLDKPHQ